MAARHHVCLSILIAGSVVACTAGSNVHSAPMPRALLVAADPAADADSALASADTSFTAVSGYSLRLPGVASVLHETLLRHYGARLLANCEVSRSQEDIDTCDAAIEYATAYNRQLLLRIVAAGEG